VFQAASRAGVRKVILASSCAVYGDEEGPVDEMTPPAPLSPYAASKLACESTAQMFSLSFDLPTICLRYFNVYGPRQSPDSPYAAAIPLFIHALLSGTSPTIFGDGHQTRDFVYVEDVVRANLMAAEGATGNGEAINISGPGAVSILEVVQTLRRLLPSGPEPVFAPPRPGDIQFSEADRSKALQALGYRPDIALERGLQLTVQWAEAQKSFSPES
jgi:UDP-glucose 4-epimerase